MKCVLPILAAVMLVGCAFDAQVISSSERTVVIRSVDGVQKAQVAADSECHKNSRHARLSGIREAQYIFDCVE